jgi:Coenzyme PQQ synthesis protein D (PqqD)
MGWLRANVEMVVHETIDGETILIHMGTGTYYSIDGAGSDAFILAAAGHSEEQIVARLAERYTTDRDRVAAGVSALVGELLDEELLVRAEHEGGADVELPEPAGPFADPELHRYTDMQEFILVDPLHDVDVAAGWPHAAAD